MMHYPALFIWLWLGAGMPSNIFFSIIFCRIAYKQYRLLGSDAWKRLTFAGVQVMFLAALSNIDCFIALNLHDTPINPEIFTTFDW
jgi:hypothetical protein